MRIILIHNPGAGDDGQPGARELEALLRNAGHEVRYQSADEDIWPAVLEHPADVVAVAGGDGTVGRVAKKLVGRNVPIAPLPFGTANNISKTLGLTELTLEEIVSGWHDGRRVKFDIGIANGPWGSRYFLEGVGVGLFACTIPAAKESRKLASLDDADEKIAYALQMLRARLTRCPAYRLDLKLDGKDMSGTYVLFEAMNMEFVGPNLYLAPHLDPCDGLLDVILVTRAEKEDLQASLASWQDGELRYPGLTRHRAAVVELEWSGYEVHFDDEAWPKDDQEKKDRPSPASIELKLEGKAIEFLAPPQAATP